MSSLSALLTGSVQSLGYLGVFILMTLESALMPIPSEVTMPFAGFLVGQGNLEFWRVVLVGTLGNLLGAAISYYIGFLLSEETVRSLLERYGKFLLLSERDYDRSLEWFGRFGSEAIFISRILPGIRTYISLPAGVFRVNIWKFLIYTFVGSLLWSAALTYIGVYLGSKWESISPAFNLFQYAVAGVFVVLIATFIYRRTRRG